MITKLSISNFKSIRQLDLDCKKVNLFIGEPNTGKSNILESLALLSWSGHPQAEALSEYIRLQRTSNLFHDDLVDQVIRISAHGTTAANIYVSFDKDQFRFCSAPPTDSSSSLCTNVDYYGNVSGNVVIDPQVRSTNIRFYRFRILDNYPAIESGNLRPPNGTNLFSVVLSSRVLREMMVEFFRKYGLMLVLKPQEKVFELQKHVDGLIVAYPYALTSDTLQRIIFYTVAITSNKDSVLVFEEPESNAFPYYTKYLGERIALDENNQFFIATHNPYLLSAIIEKGRKEDVQVFITYFKDYQTKVKPLTPDEVSELMEADPFFNLDRFVEEAQ